MNHKREENAIRSDKNWKLQEFAAFVFITAVVTCIALGVLTYHFLVFWYVIAMFIFFINSLRTLSAHAYRNPGDQPMEFHEQYPRLDKCSRQPVHYRLMGSSWLALSRDPSSFHELPYHNLGEAKRLLVNGLSDTHFI